MQRYYYSSSISDFLNQDENEVLGKLSANNEFSLEKSQRDAWIEQIRILKNVLENYREQGTLFFEYSIPRLGRRIDAVVLIKHVIFILEFKVGEEEFPAHAIDQVCDYALDLKNFHETSHTAPIVPILVSTEAIDDLIEIPTDITNDNLLPPIKCNSKYLSQTIESVLSLELLKDDLIDAEIWQQGRYCPTPTIVEAATALYSGHSVEDISRSDAEEVNLSQTSSAISEIISSAKKNSKKVICFVTGVPGAGKTLVGLNIANKHINKDDQLHSVFLSGNGPLVDILREALVRDEIRKEGEKGKKIRKGEALSRVKLFIQNVHHFRDECLVDTERPPIEHVALFDEAQRAWNLEQTSRFMRQKKKFSEFNQSEPEFLISCLDRHPDWAVIVCLVGGGQEIHTGEAGIGEWIEVLNNRYKDWTICISPNLTDSEYESGKALEKLKGRSNLIKKEEMHLAVSMRSFRAENVSSLVKHLLDLNVNEARSALMQVNYQYPIFLSRDIKKAKSWLRKRARGSERYGIMVSSQAYRLKPYGIDIRSPINPVHWFLNGKDDVRSSFYLEDVATEFHVQGLELDWACINWDADFRYKNEGWDHWQFKGKRWNRIKKEERKIYLKNAYRVLLTRARQGMVIVVPEGDASDPTRNPQFYDPTFRYLKEIGFQELVE